mmetsp:Transcript_15551/g.31811  ORF Transcript_15551/g.31811 Transcript_15551/m.31811 type:complete len:256 (-) Transcript_15551:727-1494(-)
MASTCPWAEAMMRAVNPVSDTQSTYLEFAFAFALEFALEFALASRADRDSTSAFSTPTVPFSAAFISGVTPSASRKAASAPCSKSNLAAASCPPTLAVMSAEMLSLLALLGSACRFSSAFSTSVRPSPLASHSAVTPESAGASTSAPSFRSSSTTLTWPMMDASIKAVMPSLSRALTSAPSFSSSLATSKCPALAAGMSAVKSSQSRALTSTFSSLSSFCTSFLSPSDAAPMRRAPGEDMASMSAALANWSWRGV